MTVEGTDFSGKSTLLSNLARKLSGTRRKTVFTREPGGTPAAERIRGVLLDPDVDMTDWTEAYLYAAARLDHANGLIRPALDRGENVVCDRYADSSVAYQGAGRGLGTDGVREINARATGIAAPDRTYYLRVSASERGRRAASRTSLDRLERVGDEFMQRVSDAFDEIAASEPDRVEVLDATLPPEELAGIVAGYLLGRDYTP